MNLDLFLINFTSLFEVTPKSEIKAQTKYKTIEEWDSLMALETIAMVDEELDVELNGDDIRDADTVADLYAIINSRMNA